MSTEELANWAAQRIINNGRDVSDRWEDFPFWKKHHTTLLSYRQRLGNLESCVSKLSTKNEWFINQLSEIRARLVDSYDIPPAPALVG